MQLYYVYVLLTHTGYLTYLKSVYKIIRMWINMNYVKLFIIYRLMKYRKTLIKHNAYFKKADFHSRENISCISLV